MIKLFLQIVTVLGLSVGTFWFLGVHFYVPVGLLITISIFAILMTRPWLSDAAEEQDQLHLQSLEFFYRLLLALVIGALWPSLPVILISGRARERAEADRDLFGSR